MIKIIKRWWAEFSKSAEQKYLESATDHYDLERRMKHLSRREAPFQQRIQSNLNYGRGYY